MFAVAVGSPALARTRVPPARRPPARRTSRVVVRAAESDGYAEGEDDLPPPVKLTADQARIAALAFEVLYEKDLREDMEEMLIDKERPGLRAKLQNAIKAANVACEEGATAACAAAWEEVDGLEDAAMRAGMTQNAPPGRTAAAAAAAPAVTRETKKEGEPKKEKSARMSNPATRAGVDPLAGIMPCAGDTCEAPSGTFEARLRLERALEDGGNALDEPTLTKAIREAVDVAITMCEKGLDASQCAVAWEVVEELSSSANKRRVDDGDAR